MKLFQLAIIAALCIALAHSLRTKTQSSTESSSYPFAGYATGDIVYIQSHKSGYEGRFLGYHHKSGERRPKFKDCAESSVQTTDEFRWKISWYGNYFTLENQNLPGYYMKANRKDKPVQLKSHSNPSSDPKYLWTYVGGPSQLDDKFTLINKAYSGYYMYVQDDHDLEFTDKWWSSAYAVYYKRWEPEVKLSWRELYEFDLPKWNGLQYTDKVKLFYGVFSDIDRSQTQPDKYVDETNRWLALAHRRGELTEYNDIPYPSVQLRNAFYHCQGVEATFITNQTVIEVGPSFLIGQEEFTVNQK